MDALVQLRHSHFCGSLESGSGRNDGGVQAEITMAWLRPHKQMKISTFSARYTQLLLCHSERSEESRNFTLEDRPLDSSLRSAPFGMTWLKLVLYFHIGDELAPVRFI